MKLFEITTPYDNPTVEYGIMTKEEYLKHMNPDEKFHPSDSYDFDIKKLNQKYGHSKHLKTTHNEYDFIEYDSGTILKDDGKVFGVIIDDILYYVEKKIKLPFVWEDYHREIHTIDAKSSRQVKYIDSYVSKILDVSAANMKKYPNVLNRFLNNGEQMSVRSHDSLSENDGQTIVIMNSENLVVATAQDEWGATLIVVAKEYRNRGLGKIIVKYWRDNNPKYRSGGFTSSGQQSALNYYYERVRTLLKNGWYPELIQDGKITIEKVKEIVSALPKTKKHVSKTVKQDAQPKPLIMHQSDLTYIVYDLAFFDEPSEEYVYGIVDFGERAGTIFPRNVDYDPKWKKLIDSIIAYVIETDAMDYDPTLAGADFIEELTPVSPLPDIAHLSKVEKVVRGKLDSYDENYYQIEEIANTKWR